MSITWDCKEQGLLETSEQTAEEKTAKRVYICIASEPASSVEAEYAAGIIRGSVHPKDAARRCRTISPTCDPESNRLHWRVEFGYTDKPFQDQNPVDTPATYEWDGDEGTEHYFLDNSSTPKPVVNSAGERFTELPERDTGATTCTVSKFVDYDSYDPSIGVAYKNAVNSDGITIDGKTVAALQCKCKKITAGPKQTTTYVDEFGVQQTVDYREARAILQLRREGWRDKFEDRGFNEKYGSSKLKEIIKGIPPVKPDTPWPLNGSGVSKTNVTDTPATREFKPYDEIAFGPLGLA